MKVKISKKPKKRHMVKSDINNNSINVNEYKFSNFQDKDDPLIEGLKNGIIDSNSIVDDKTGETLLHYAVNKSNLALIKLLLEKNANINASDGKGRTPLISAVLRGNLEVIRLLINKGADVNSLDEEKLGPLHHAILKKNLNAVKELVEGGADINGNYKTTPLYCAVFVHNLKIVQYLIEHKADINAQDINGVTALHCAVNQGNFTLVKSLVERGADIFLINKKGMSPLGLARLSLIFTLNITDKNRISTQEQKKIIRYLYGKLSYNDEKTLSHLDSQEYINDRITYDIAIKDCDYVQKLINAKVNIDAPRSESGITFMHYAALKGNLQLMKQLMNHNARLDVKDKDGRTPAHYAIWLIHDSSICYENSYRNKKVISYLIDVNTDFNVQDKYGLTPIHYAILIGDLQTIKYFLEKNANFNLRDNKNRTLLHYCLKVGSTPMAEYLISRSDLNARDNEGRISLHYATNLEIADHLLKARGYLWDKILNIIGLNYFKDSKGRTPLHLAVQRGNLEVMSLLVSKRPNFNIKDNEGKTPLHYASTNLKAIKILTADRGFFRNLWNKILNLIRIMGFNIKARNTNVNIQDNYGKTPLHYAIEQGSLKPIKYLIEEKDANINVLDNNGSTPLHLAILNRNLKIIKYLVEHKADISICDKNGNTPVQCALKDKRCEEIRNHFITIAEVSEPLADTQKVIAIDNTAECHQNKEAAGFPKSKMDRGEKKPSFYLSDPFVEPFIPEEVNLR